MQRDAMQLVGVAIISAASWFTGYFAQKLGGGRSVTVRPHAWVAWPCGNPRGDGTMDVAGGGTQIVGLVPLAGWPLMLFFGVSLGMRAILVFTSWLGATVGVICLGEWLKWRTRRRRKDQRATRHHGIPAETRSGLATIDDPTHGEGC